MKQLIRCWWIEWFLFISFTFTISNIYSSWIICKLLTIFRCICLVFFINLLLDVFSIFTMFAQLGCHWVPWSRRQQHLRGGITVENHGSNDRDQKGRSDEDRLWGLWMGRHQRVNMYFHCLCNVFMTSWWNKLKFTLTGFWIWLNLNLSLYSTAHITPRCSHNHDI